MCCCKLQPETTNTQAQGYQIGDVLQKCAALKLLRHRATRLEMCATHIPFPKGERFTHEGETSNTSRDETTNKKAAELLEDQAAHEYQMEKPANPPNVDRQAPPIHLRNRLRSVLGSHCEAPSTTARRARATVIARQRPKATGSATAWCKSGENLHNAGIRRFTYGNLVTTSPSSK